MGDSGNSLTALLFLSCILLLISKASGSQHERMLLNDLLLNYNPLERPIEKPENAVNVSVGVTVMQLLKLDPKTKTMQSNLWLTIEWNDFNLKWDPTKHANISTLRIPPSRIWKPDIFAFNSADKEFDTTFETNAIVKSDGNVSYITPGIFTTTCKMDFTWFPFDHQKCSIKFGSWAWDGGDLDLQLQSEDGGDMGSFISNPEWELVAFPATRNVIYYSCCPEPYIDVTFLMHLKRRGESYYTQASTHNTLVYATVLLSFLVPAASCHKITLSILGFLMSIWTFFVVQAPVPEPSESYFVKYFGFLILLSYIGLVLNVFTVYLFHKMSAMPDWARSFIVEKIPSSPLRFICPVNKASKTKGKLLDSEKVENSTGQCTSAAKPELQHVNEWVYLACILDRCFFVLFIILLVASYTCWYPSMAKMQG